MKGLKFEHRCSQKCHGTNSTEALNSGFKLGPEVKREAQTIHLSYPTQIQSTTSPGLSP